MTFSAKTTLAAALLGATAMTACEAADDTLPADAAPAAVEEAVAEVPPAEEMAEEAMETAEAAVEEMAAEQETIVAIAAGNDELSTLVAAVTAAELVDTLNSEGPFTVFAPPNSAFEKIDADTLASLLEPEQKETLTGILTYHVVAGEVMAADLVAAIEGAEDGAFAITTVNGATLTASIVDGAPVLTDAAGNTSNITATDIDASNGVVHLIDTVVMPG
ncbi:MAG: fasciclin domain-containing protein [Pseudomonadota bacterium]